MARYETHWTGVPAVQPQDLDKVCRQVYVWIVTKDRYVVIVSKDGSEWQLPGGKPEPDETLLDTAIREVREETHLNIGQQSDRLRFFGYQTVKETRSEIPPYLQVRYLLQLDMDAAILDLSVQAEDGQQQEEDIIRFVDVVSLDKLLVERLSWLEGSPEFTAVKALVSA